ncbi:glycosyltransferase [Pontibacter diazotrophicus]|uniref:Glycosyltransferase n=1 Tax=Pontibacter diazotrophicus TaxID=1400979 RepID=A0A3D8LC32_9BACT|nr:glycosyltransferase family 4 protein [Pontibacter diazotrophicus]RDV14856.1 glycosyltransferase [Pontibacter diazotrophicus]
MTQKPKVLISIDWFTPGYKAGGPIQSCANIVAHLQNELDFYIITRDTDYCESEPYTGIKSNSWNRVADNVQVYYFSSDQLHIKHLYNVIKAIKPDTAFVNGIYSFYFSVLPLLILKRLKHRNIIVSARGMLAKSAIHVKGGKKKLFLKVAQLTSMYKGIRFHATHEGEKQDIVQALGVGAKVVIAPNLPKKAATLVNEKRLKHKGELKLISVARISPEKNTKYALEVLERCAGVGKVTFDIYGPVYNAAYWDECQEVIKRLPKNVVVNYKGSLESGRVAATLPNYHAMLMPTRGENFGHIILESFTAGCPVIISDQTPWKNLTEFGIGYDLPLNKIEDFVEAIRELSEKEQENYDTSSEKAYLYSQQFLNDEKAVGLNHLMLQ